MARQNFGPKIADDHAAAARKTRAAKRPKTPSSRRVRRGGAAGAGYKNKPRLGFTRFVVIDSRRAVRSLPRTVSLVRCSLAAGLVDPGYLAGGDGPDAGIVEADSDASVIERRADPCFDHVRRGDRGRWWPALRSAIGAWRGVASERAGVRIAADLAADGAPLSARDHQHLEVLARRRPRDRVADGGQRRVAARCGGPRAGWDRELSEPLLGAAGECEALGRGRDVRRQDLGEHHAGVEWVGRAGIEASQLLHAQVVWRVCRALLRGDVAIDRDDRCRAHDAALLGVGAPERYAVGAEHDPPPLARHQQDVRVVVGVDLGARGVDELGPPDRGLDQQSLDGRGQRGVAVSEEWPLAARSFAQRRGRCWWRRSGCRGRPARRWR